MHEKNRIAIPYIPPNFDTRLTPPMSAIHCGDFFIENFIKRDMRSVTRTKNCTTTSMRQTRRNSRFDIETWRGCALAARGRIPNGIDHDLSLRSADLMRESDDRLLQKLVSNWRSVSLFWYSQLLRPVRNSRVRFSAN